MLVLEDLHWADPASIELLRSLAAHLTHQALLVVGTYRVDELTRQHPLTRQLPALIRESNAVRLELKRLTAEDLRQLVAGQFTLAAADEARLIRYLGDHAEGNPFFAAELLRALRETLVLQPAGDRWTLGTLDQLVLPSLLRQVIDSRVDRLGEEHAMFWPSPRSSGRRSPSISGARSVRSTKRRCWGSWSGPSPPISSRRSARDASPASSTR